VAPVLAPVAIGVHHWIAVEDHDVRDHSFVEPADLVPEP
jgi:hypothetical protein